MKTILVVLAMVFIASTAMAEEPSLRGLEITNYEIVPAGCPPPPCPECQPVTVTCQCDCGQVELPGYWEMSIRGRKLCGTITVIGSGFLFNDNYFAINQLKKAKAVESCE